MSAPDPAAVEGWLRDRVPAVDGPVILSRAGAGQSNLTFLVTDAAGRRWVLRCPPPGTYHASAHDVHREARVIAALHGSAVPVPDVIGIGTELGEWRAPFFVMSCAPGAALESEADAEQLTGAQRRELGADVVGVLAALHSVDVDAVGLGELGPRANYVLRQLRRCRRTWELWADTELRRRWERCCLLVEADLPPQQRTTLAHGDFRLSNLLVEGSRVTAVLDWELCTLGDPLADVAYLLDDWRGPGEPAIAIPCPTRAGGFPARDELLADYVARTGLDVTRIEHYRAFTQLRAATLLQGVLVRMQAGVRGQHAPDPDDLGGTVEYLVGAAEDRLG